MQEIVTQRLQLRLLAHEDVAAFVAYRRNPDVARYQSWDTSYTTADGERLVASHTSRSAARGWSLLANHVFA